MNLQNNEQNNLLKIRYSYSHTAFPVQTFLFIKIENIYSAPLWQQGDERIQKLGPVLRLQFDDCKRKTDTHELTTVQLSEARRELKTRLPPTVHWRKYSQGLKSKMPHIETWVWTNLNQWLFRIPFSAFGVKFNFWFHVTGYSLTLTQR